VDRVADRLSETQAGIKLHTVMRHTELSTLMGPFVRRLTVSSFDGFLACTAFSKSARKPSKRVIADRIEAAMERDCLTKAAMAIRMQIGHSALIRLIACLMPPIRVFALPALQRAAVLL